MPHLVFVCTGNTCRSPMAEILFKKMVKKFDLNEEWQVSSAGIAAFPGQTISREAARVLKEEGFDQIEHSSRQLSETIISKADLILTMTDHHKQTIVDKYPEEGKKVYTLKEFVETENGINVSDPFGYSETVYRQVRDEIKEHIKALLGRLNQFKIEEGKFNKIQNNNVRGENLVKIAIGSDHAGYRMKMEIIDYFQETDYMFTDMGTDSDQSVDYPDYGYKVARAVADKQYDLGILICGTGIGMSITANKVPGIRAALCHDVFSAKATRNHNNSNILTMGARTIGSGLALEIVKVWLGEDFAGGRHQRRIDKISNIERGDYIKDE